MLNQNATMSPEFKPGLVSVIIPTHNREELLLKSLESVQQQSYRPIEIILVDDASTDNTPARVAEFSRRYSNKDFTCRYFRQNHSNASLCRNHGLQQSRGEFIQFLDSDDIIHPDKFNQQVTALHNSLLDGTALDFVWSSTIQFEQQPDWLSQVYVGHDIHYPTKQDVIIDFINKSQWRTESGLFTRNACIKTGEWSPVAMFQDWEFHLRLLSWLPNIACVPGNFSAARQHQQGRIGDKWSNGSGLCGALTALIRVAIETSGSCKNRKDWQQAILARGEEIKTQALKTGYPDVAKNAESFIQEFINTHKPKSNMLILNTT